MVEQTNTFLVVMQTQLNLANDLENKGKWERAYYFNIGVISNCIYHLKSEISTESDREIVQKLADAASQKALWCKTRIDDEKSKLTPKVSRNAASAMFNTAFKELGSSFMLAYESYKEQAD
jgi:hypothetical protein